MKTSPLHVMVTAEDNETSQTYTVFAKRQPVYDVPSILWNFVEQDDLAGAYWMARAMIAQGLKPPAPPQVLKALQGGRWLSPDSDNYVADLFDIVGQFEAADDDDAQTLPSAVCRPTAIADRSRDKSPGMAFFPALLTVDGINRISYKGIRCYR